MGRDVQNAVDTGEVTQPAGGHRSPVPIEHTCDRSDISRCACSRARQRERRRERDRERAEAARQVREERQAEQWAREPMPRPRKVLMDPLVRTCDGTDRKTMRVLPHVDARVSAKASRWHGARGRGQSSRQPLAALPGDAGADRGHESRSREPMCDLQAPRGRDRTGRRRSATP
jgi:hypothetical protein